MSLSFVTSILRATSLVPGLPQHISNGNSTLGTVSPGPPNLPFSVGPPSWGSATPANTNPYTQVPNTGFVHNHVWNITRGTIAPDGVEVGAILVNGAFPGPLLEANWGDVFNITVHNNIAGPSEGTLLHWHGLLHKGAPWYDGAPAVHSCPIAPGSSFVYTFTADLYGTSWWHSHYSAQLADGLMGPVIIHGPTQVPYDIDIGPVILSDHYHNDYHYYIDETSGLNFEPPFADNNLINGKMFFNCSLVINGQKCTPNAAISKFKFQTGKTHRLRLINAGAEGLQRFSIDGHVMTVIANDFVPIVPYNTKVVTLAVGQRTDVIVSAVGKPTDAFWMRANTSSICSASLQPYALAAIYYDKASSSAAPKSSAWPYIEVNCNNDPLSKTVPFYPLTPPAKPAVTQNIDVTLGVNASGNALFFMNGESFRGNYDHPILLLAGLGNTSYPDDPQWNVYNFGSNSSVRLVIRNTTPLAHPMHIHGHNFWVLAEGRGPVWDGVVTNPRNPQRRDVQMMANGTVDDPGFIVLEFVTDNPGVWPLHCHISWHVSTGLYINIVEQPEKIKALKFPPSIAQTCRDWAVYSNHTVVDQIDSGL
ncbi:hypothetical protein MMC25_007616 [Agyrium rufum]|nr:hypothetical protein [Agyrium rufum]